VEECGSRSSPSAYKMGKIVRPPGIDSHSALTSGADGSVLRLSAFNYVQIWTTPAVRRIAPPGFQQSDSGCSWFMKKCGMGGRNSGRWHDHEKARTTEACIALDTTAFRRNFASNYSTGTLTWETTTGETLFHADYCINWTGTGEPTVHLDYVGDKEGAVAVISEQFALSATKPTFGGQRWWLLCPKCGGRVRKVYLPKMGDSFSCRRCHGLSYRSCQQSGTLAGAFEKFRRQGAFPWLDA